MVLVIVLPLVAVIVYLCDQFSLDWLRYFNELVASVKIPI